MAIFAGGVRMLSTLPRYPSPQPMTYPDSTPRTKVWKKSCESVQSEPRDRAAIAPGAGSSTDGTPKPRTATSHR
jgi:hypothetical protein